MSASRSSAQAEVLHRLHAPGKPLVLVNAWDAVSARVLEQAGAAVIATTSAGMAWALGCADGEQLPRDELIAACARICRVVQAPVSVDIERGYGGGSAEVVALVEALIELGVCGVNIEDGVATGTQRLNPPEVLAERIAALRELARRRGVRLFINARTDVYFAPHDQTSSRFDEALARARRYVAAGADGIFVPGLHRLDDLARFAQAIDRPLNVYAGYPGVPSVAELAAAGVRRVSLGCGPLQSALGLLGRIAGEAFGPGRFELMCQGMASAGELNALFVPRPCGASTRG